MEMKERYDNFLFGKAEELTIRRIGKNMVSVHIARKDLSGVEKLQLTIVAGEPLKYTIEGVLV